eukprot:10781600-Karenia_brevis.AAC.1
MDMAQSGYWTSCTESMIGYALYIITLATMGSRWTTYFTTSITLKDIAQTSRRPGTIAYRGM